MAAPVITFLSDYGLDDEFVGVVHGVIARICPEARVIDVTHGVPRHDVLAGALALERALPHMPPGVHLAVVDPEVGARRRAVAVRCAEDGRLLIGPDNGLLMAAAERFGGAVEAIEISHSPWRLEPLSATFHGRDLFAPVAARLAAGEKPAEAGAPLDPEELVALPRPAPVQRADGTLVAQVVATDTFGNLILNAHTADVADFQLGHELLVNDARGRAARTFADVAPGDLLVYEDAGGALAVAVNTGDAAATLGLRAGDEVRLRIP